MTAFTTRPLARVLGRLTQALAASALLLALVAALPWALWHYLGWPLPDHLPTAEEVQAVLLSPLSTPLLLDVLACLCWITWAAFVIDVMRCVLAAVRGLRWPELQSGGPVHAVAAVLVGALVVCLLSNRTPATTPTPPQARPIATVHLTAPQPADTVVVRAPEHGIHDSLSRIAARTLGDTRRWPEIFKANKGKPQPHGGTLTNPNLIFPGERLTLPHSPTPKPTVPAPVPPRLAPMTPPSSTPATPTPSARQSPPPTTMPRATPAPRGSGPGTGWEPGVFVGLGLATAISAAATMARRRYRPGSGRRDDLPVAPLVYQLRLAHLRAEHDSPNAPSAGEMRAAPELGVRDGRKIALDLAVARGLGLVGAGALAAARALLLAMLAPAHGAQVIVPTDDLALLLGPEHPDGARPAALRVVANLDAALDELETETLHRAREDDPAALVLVARPPQENTQRLQAVLDNGAHLGLLGVLLGQWRTGISAYIRADGTVSAASPGPGQALLGTRMFHLPEAQTADLLALLHHATPTGGDGPLLEVTAIPSPEPGLTTPQPRCKPISDHGDHPTKSIRLTVLGSPRIHWIPDRDGTTRDITAAFSPRQREFLVFLALHPEGVHRDPLVATLWKDSPPERPTNALNTALSRLRRAVHTATGGAISDITTVGDGRYRLDPHRVEVDYWRLSDAITAQRAAGSHSERIAAYQQVVDCYTGVLAEGLDAEWIDAPREATRRDALDAVAALARALVDSDPQRTLDLLETARTFDPHNELLYRDIMRLQERLGHLDAIPRTLTLLTTRLAEIDETPTPHAIDLAARLQQRHEAMSADVTRDRAHAR